MGYYSRIKTDFVLSMLVGGVITGVAKTALYVYATEGIQPDEFYRFDFDSMFESDDSGPSKTSTGPGGLRNSNRGL